MPPAPIRVREDPESSDPLFGQTFDEGVAKLDTIFKARLKVAKKRTVPNARELVASYNRRTQYEEVLDINDVEQIEWIDLGPDRKFCTGRDVPPMTCGGLTVGITSCGGSKVGAALLAVTEWCVQRD